MNLFERRSAIIRILVRDGQTTVANLAEEFGVSPRTIYSDITALSLSHPIQTTRGRYGGGVKLADWFHPHSNALSPEQEELLQRVKNTLKGNDLVVLNSILDLSFRKNQQEENGSKRKSKRHS